MRSNSYPRFRPLAAALVRAAGLSVAAMAAVGCAPRLESLDDHAQLVVNDHVKLLGPEAAIPDVGGPPLATASSNIVVPDRVTTEYTPRTINPLAAELTFEVADPSRNVAATLERYTSIPEDAPTYDLPETMNFAIEHAPEYRFAKEEIFLAALQLMAERHRFGPRFFDEITADFDASMEEGDFDTALRLVNELGVSQQLKTGGSLAATAVVQATEQLRQVVNDGTNQSAAVILSANLPLLRGAGDVAQEALISAEREMVYATRRFERFRRQFLFDIATEYFDLVQTAVQVDIAERSLERRRALERETQALYDRGRRAEFELSESRQRVLDSENSLASTRDRFIFQLEQFRVRLGLPPDSLFLIDPDTNFDLPVPVLEMTESVRRGLLYRLDLQTERDQVVDARRAVDNARNDMLPDFDLSAGATFTTDPDDERAGLQIDFDETDFQAGVTFGLPLDRKLERIDLREATVGFERALRDLRETEDRIALAIRADIRDIELSILSLQLQGQNVRMIERRLYGLDLRDDVTTRTKIDAQDELVQAQTQLAAARRDLRVSVMRYLLDTGQFRVGSDGRFIPPAGLESSLDPDRPDPWDLNGLGRESETPAPTASPTGDDPDAPAAVPEDRDGGDDG